MNKLSPNDSDWLDEYHNGTRYGLAGKILKIEQSKYQKITIFESFRYGKGLLLDNCWMTAEKQEKHYHECLVHPAMSSATEIKNILIIGGGDGGSAKQSLLYKEVEKIDLVEIDDRVPELSKEFMPSIGGNAWHDSRLNIHFQDGTSWVENKTDDTYDVIIVDSSDPEGPAKGLFNRRFFENCRRILKPGGVFGTQSESPEAFRKVHVEIILLLRDLFEYADPLYGWVPMYPSGWWSWTFASMEHPYYLNPKQNRSISFDKECDIWSQKWQKAGFDMMPAFIKKDLK